MNNEYTEYIVYVGSSLRYEGAEKGSNAGAKGEPPNDAALIERSWTTFPILINRDENIDMEAKRIRKQNKGVVVNYKKIKKTELSFFHRIIKVCGE